MRKFTKKELKAFITKGFAEDITQLKREEVLKIWNSGNTEKIGYSSGVYGINGGIFVNNDTGVHYVITARNSNLLSIF